MAEDCTVSVPDPLASTIVSLASTTYVSSPVPPFKASAPEPPISVSLPAPPVRVSLPRIPRISFAEPFPVMLSFPSPVTIFSKVPDNTPSATPPNEKDPPEAILITTSSFTAAIFSQSSPPSASEMVPRAPSNPVISAYSSVK